MQLHYQALGTGHPLIILHGLFGSLANWKSLARAFSERYRVVVVDQRNHGRSPHHDAFNYAVMAEDVCELIAAQGLGSTYLLGHSMGGKTAMQVAFTYPELVDKLIVVDIAPKQYPPHHDEILDALRAVDVGAFTKRSELEAALAARIPDQGVRRFLMMNAANDETGRLKWRLNLDAIEANYDRIGQGLHADRPFTKPTLFIKGERSSYIQPADRPLLDSLFPHCQVTAIPNAGHWVHAAAPERFAATVLSFLEA